MPPTEYRNILLLERLFHSICYKIFGKSRSPNYYYYASVILFEVNNPIWSITALASHICNVAHTSRQII